MFAGCGDERFLHLLHIAAISHAHRKTKPHAWIAIMSVGHRRIDEFRVWHDHGDIIACQDNCAARANLLHSADDPRHFHAVPDRDRSLCQNDQAADEITGDILETESDAYANCARKNRQCSQMNTRVLQDNKNAHHENDVAENLGDGVLERTIKSAVSKKPIKKKTLRSG